MLGRCAQSEQACKVRIGASLVRCVLDGIAVRSCGLLDCCHERGCSSPSVWGAARRNGVVAVRMRLSGLATGGPSRYACMRYLFGY